LFYTGRITEIHEVSAVAAVLTSHTRCHPPPRPPLALHRHSPPPAPTMLGRPAPPPPAPACPSAPGAR
jgi:hypothetical protein